MSIVDEVEAVATGGSSIWMKLIPYVAFVVVVAGAAYGMYHHGYGVAKAEDKIVSDALIQKHAAETISLQGQVAATEHKAADDMAAIDAQHQKDFANEKAKTDSTIAALLDGTLRLRKRLAAIHTTTCAVSNTSTCASSSDDTASVGLQQSDAELLVRYAAEADAITDQLRACQAIVVEDRKVK